MRLAGIFESTGSTGQNLVQAPQMEAKGEGAAEAIVVRSSGRPTVPSNKPSDPAHVMVLASMEKEMSISAACKKHKVWKGTFCRYVAAAVWCCAHAPSGWSSPAPISF